jgi:phosphoenolpyruvate synthase/pyruvate phosphate dikinase
MDWCSKATRLSVRTNADTPEQTAQAIAFGAEGIGLTRTEHMFFEGDRIDADARDDPRRLAAGPQKPPWRSSCRTSARTSSASSRR